ncbi:MAG: transcriptional repressor NrdR [Clostridiales bacterium]|nr:transcriptional repressor NrdR [Clostridiales bacterium]
MRCPNCGASDMRVLDSRPAQDGYIIKRRRACNNCQKRYTTYEMIEKPEIFVVKKDGRREVFDEEKIMRGLIKACEKRPISIEVLRGIVQKIKDAAENSMASEIDSNKIGEMIMEELKPIDEIAYVRFASVYRQFKDINSLMDEINSFLRTGVSEK